MVRARRASRFVWCISAPVFTPMTSRGEDPPPSLSRLRPRPRALYTRPRCLRCLVDASPARPATPRRYTKAIESCPEGAPVAVAAAFYGNRAAAHARLADHRAAAADCTASLTLRPDYPKVLVRRAEALEAQGDARFDEVVPVEHAGPAAAIRALYTRSRDDFTAALAQQDQVGSKDHSATDVTRLKLKLNGGRRQHTGGKVNEADGVRFDNVLMLARFMYNNWGLAPPAHRITGPAEGDYMRFCEIPRGDPKMSVGMALF